MSEFEVSDGEMEEDWTDTRWAVPDMTGTLEKDDKVYAMTGTNEPMEIKLPEENKEKQSETAGEPDKICDDRTETSEKEVPPLSSGTGEKRLMSRMALNDNKAGMQGLDKERINQIIYEASKGSRFYENELKREKQTNLKIEEQAEKMEALDEREIKSGEKEADKLLQELENTRDLTRTIMHIDMDAFYAAVEMRDKAELKHKPMAVGGNSMLSTSNYLARRYGVRAAMPGFIGKKLCPDLVIVPTNFAKYTEVSNQVREILKEYDPNFCPMSLDEAYLDLTNHLEKRKTMSEEERTYMQLYQENQKRIEDKNDNDACIQATSETVEEIVKEKEVDNRQPDDVEESVTNDVNSASPSEMQNSKGGKDGIAALSEHQPEQQNLQNAEVFKGSKANNEATEETTVIDHEEERKVAAESESVTPEDAEVAEIDAMQSKVIREQGTPVTFGISAMEAVREIRLRIEQKTQLTASAGIAPNMMLSKVCSDKNKPNGQYYIPPNKAAVMDFINTLPIRKVPGIGKVAEKMLSALEVTTCADLHKKRGLIFHLYSTVSFKYFMQICLGIGSTKVERDSERKSMSVERTFGEINKPAELYKKLYELCESLSEDLVEERYLGKTVTIKLKTVEFELKTRGKTLGIVTNQQADIYSAARDLLKIEIQNCQPQPLRLRLMGVRLSNLSRQDAKKQSTITEMFANQKGSPRKHKLPVDSKDEDIIPAKRARLDEKPPPASQDQETKSLSSTSPTGDGVVSEASEADSEATEIYWPPKDNGLNTSNHDTEISAAQGPMTSLVERSDSRLVSSDEYFAKPQLMPMPGGTSIGAKARDTPTTKALIKAQGSEPISCPVCGREFKSRNMEHITSHIDHCLDAANQTTAVEGETTTERKDHEPDGEELFEDECEELFSSQESQILLSQENNAKSGEDEKTETQKTVEIETEKNVDETDDDTMKNVESKETEEIPTEPEKSDATAQDLETRESEETQTKTLHGAETENRDQDLRPAVDRDQEEAKSDTSEKVAENINKGSEEMISEVTETSDDAEETHKEAESHKETADVEPAEQTVNGNANISENRLNSRGIDENGLTETTTAEMLCPVCNVVQLLDLRLFNIHVDRCLKKQETSDVEGTSFVTQSETPSQSNSTKSPNEKGSSSNDDNALSYLKNITPRRPLRTGASRKSVRSPTSFKTSASALGKRDTPTFTPVRTTVSNRVTHTSITKVSSSDGPARSVDDEETEMVCPLCNVALYNVSLTAFNQHVDGCLNRQTIKELIHEQDIHNYKRPENSSPENQPSTKKKKLSSSQPVSNPMKKIYSFFSKKS